MKNWNKFDILHVAESLKHKTIFLYKGIFFMNLANRVDHLTTYLTSQVAEASGAMATSLIREIVRKSFAEVPCPSCEFLLKHTDKDVELIPTVVFGGAPSKEEKQQYFHFAIAHEIGHVIGDHLDPKTAATAETELGRQREREADAFACEVLGTNKPGIELLEMFVEMIKESQAAVRVDQLSGTASLAVALVQQRIDWMR